MLRIGVISDTHGLLRPEAVSFLRGSSHIVHAGDIGNARVLEALASIAPCTAVRGNNDVGAWADQISEIETVRIAGVAIQVIHDLGELECRAGQPNARVVISGHSHQPKIERRGEILFLNPGSAGPRRFKLPVSVAELLIGHRGAVEARVHELSITPAERRKQR
jgi:putative phosphoesterase